jgi:hypothetical protein
MLLTFCETMRSACVLTMVCLQGRLFITQRHACFVGSFTNLQVKMPFSRMTSVHKEKALLGLMATALEILCHVSADLRLFHN